MLNKNADVAEGQEALTIVDIQIESALLHLKYEGKDNYDAARGRMIV